jgi:uncharacterized protein (DUF362 family)/Pyruvate/2-oxoacid:ferredoxin oxidoreductase delta subunit
MYVYIDGRGADMAKVSIAKCENYEIEKVQSSVDRVLENLGGLDKFVKKGDRVFLKINLVMRKSPDSAATTHPAVVEAVSRRLVEAGCSVIIGDSPGGPYNRAILQSIYRGCGIDRAAENSGAVLNYDCSDEEYAHPEGAAVKRLQLIKPMMDCDRIITISKLKTHGMALYTGAVKIMFGAIPGVLKAEYHYKMPDIANFTNMLVDICTLTKSVLSIIDGIVGMEGDGPTAGMPVESKVLLASENPFELDVVGARIMGISPKDVPTIQRCMERDIISGDMNDIEIVGDNPSDVQKPYKVPDIRTINFSGKVPRFVERFISRRVLPRPIFSREICIGCSSCKQTCPPGAITMVDGRPEVNLEKCIRCFCCQELCPQKAVEIKRPWVLRRILK